MTCTKNRTQETRCSDKWFTHFLFLCAVKTGQSSDLQSAPRPVLCSGHRRISHMFLKHHHHITCQGNMSALKWFCVHPPSVTLDLWSPLSSSFWFIHHGESVDYLLHSSASASGLLWPEVKEGTRVLFFSRHCDCLIVLHFSRKGKNTSYKCGSKVKFNLQQI